MFTVIAIKMMTVTVSKIFKTPAWASEQLKDWGGREGLNGPPGSTSCRGTEGVECPPSEEFELTALTSNSH